MFSAQRMEDYLRYKSSLSPQVSELAILLVAREWNSPVEWAIHQPTALQGRRIPGGDWRHRFQEPLDRPLSRAGGYAMMDELKRTRTVSDGTYAQAVGALGEQGVNDLSGLYGYCTLLAMTLNTAQTSIDASNSRLARAGLP
jgi:4-carboxymuconolactone decarboxylase